ncbi:MAG: transposase, partial [Pontiellaceae bacterium]|nr:transposase [Pontiellaceae bacterium]
MKGKPVPAFAQLSRLHPFDHIRRTALKNTWIARATRTTIRNKLIRIGTICLRNTRCVRFHLSSSCPHQDLFAIAA